MPHECPVRTYLMERQLVTLPEIFGLNAIIKINCNAVPVLIFFDQIIDVNYYYY